MLSIRKLKAELFYVKKSNSSYTNHVNSAHHTDNVNQETPCIYLCSSCFNMDRKPSKGTTQCYRSSNHNCTRKISRFVSIALRSNKLITMMRMNRCSSIRTKFLLCFQCKPQTAQTTQSTLTVWTVRTTLNKKKLESHLLSKTLTSMDVLEAYESRALFT